MKTKILIILSVFSLNTWAIESAQYFRVWQGVQKPELCFINFLEELSFFMKETVDLYAGRALNNYIVVIPPKDRPRYIPDELALVALSSQEAYHKIRSTSEGQRYSERHWDVFDKNGSQSAQHFINYFKEHPETLHNNWAYDMIGKDIDWASGVNYIYIGTRKNTYSTDQFLSRLNTHVKLAKNILNHRGLEGYIVLANENFEVAYLNWKTKEAHDLALLSSEARKVFQDASDFMDQLMYEQAISIRAGASVMQGAAYSTLQKEEML